MKKKHPKQSITQGEVQRKIETVIKELEEELLPETSPKDVWFNHAIRLAITIVKRVFAAENKPCERERDTYVRDKAIDELAKELKEEYSVLSREMPEEYENVCKRIDCIAKRMKEDNKTQ